MCCSLLRIAAVIALLPMMASVVGPRVNRVPWHIAWTHKTDESRINQRNIMIPHLIHTISVNNIHSISRNRHNNTNMFRTAGTASFNENISYGRSHRPSISGALVESIQLFKMGTHCICAGGTWYHGSRDIALICAPRHEYCTPFILTSVP